MPDLIHSALNFAEEMHAGQKRKYTSEPYIVHPIMVATIVACTAEHDDEMLAAALLHDVVEDTSATLHDILHMFGADVAALVGEVTDVSVPSDGNRAKRKEKDRIHLSEASTRGQTIKLADIIENSESIIAHDKKFARVYMAEIALLLPVLHGDAELKRIAENIVSGYYERGM